MNEDSLVMFKDNIKENSSSILRSEKENYLSVINNVVR